MFVAKIIVCAMATDYCVVGMDERGPYELKADCIERVEQMANDHGMTLASDFLGLPVGMAYTVRKVCEIDNSEISL